MKATRKASTAKQTKQTRMKSPMYTIFVSLLVIIAVAAIAFFLLLFRLPLESADSWLKAISIELGTFTFLVGASAIIVGHVVNQRQTDKVLAVERGNIELQRTLEAERTTRLELEKTLQPRRIGFTTESLKSLQQFSGTKVVILSLADWEAWKTAKSLEFLLMNAGWNVLGTARTLDEKGFMDGIVLDMKVTPPVRSPLEPAVKTLVEYIRSYKVEVRSYSSNVTFPPEIPTDAVLIRVGLKPQTYFDDKSRQEMMERMQKPE